MSKKILSLAMAVVMLVAATSMLLLPANAAQVTASAVSATWQEAHLATSGYWAGNAGANQGIPQKAYTDKSGLVNSNTVPLGVKYQSQFTVGALNAETKEFVLFDTWVPGGNYLTSSRWLDQYNNVSGVGSTVPAVENRCDSWFIPIPVSGWHICFRYTSTKSDNIGFLPDNMIYDTAVTGDNQSGVCFLRNGQLWGFSISNADAEFEGWDDWSYTDVTTWPLVSDIAVGEGKPFTGNQIVNLYAGCTFDWVISYVSGTNHCAFRNPNMHTWKAGGNENGLYMEQSSLTTTALHQVNNWGPGGGTSWDGTETAAAYITKVTETMKPVVNAGNGWEVGSLTSTGFSPLSTPFYLNGASFTFDDEGAIVASAMGEDANARRSWLVSKAYYTEKATALATLDTQVDTPITEGEYAGGYISYTNGDAWSNPGGVQYTWEPTGHHVSQANDGNAFAYQYTAKSTGNAKLSLNSLWLSSTNGTAYQTYFAVAINGTVVWPASATLAGSRDAWYKLNSAADKDALNAALGEKIFAVTAGDTIEFCFAHSVSDWGGSFANDGGTSNVKVDPKVQIESGVTVTTRDNAALTLGGQFYLLYNIQTNGEAGIAGLRDQDGNLYTGFCCARNVASGKMINIYQIRVPVSAKNAGKSLTLTPYYAYTENKGDIDYIAAASAYAPITLGQMLNNYVGNADAKVAATAKSMVQYAAAAQTFFGSKDALVNAGVEAVAPAGDYSDKELATTACTGTKEVNFKGIALALPDQLSMKLFAMPIEGADMSGYHLVVADNAEFENAFSVAFKANEEIYVEGQGCASAASFVINPGNYNTTYYMYIADASDNVVSDQLAYSVAAYCNEMQEATENGRALKPLLDSLLAVYEAAVAE